MHGPEGVVDVEVGQRGEPVGQGAAGVVVLRCLGRLEADVLQQADVAVGQRRDRGLRAAAGGVGGQRHLDPQQLGQPGRDRRQAVPVVALALRAAEVGRHDDAGAGLAERLQGGQAGPDAAVVGDDPLAGGVVEGDVQVGAQEHAPTLHTLGDELVDGAHAQSFDPTSAVRSTRRLE